MQAIARGFRAPVIRQVDVEMLGQAGKGGAALLTTATAVGIAVQRLHQQIAGHPLGVLGGQASEPAQIGVVSPSPGRATAGGGASSARVGEKCGAERFDLTVHRSVPSTV